MHILYVTELIRYLWCALYNFVQMRDKNKSINERVVVAQRVEGAAALLAQCLSEEAALQLFPQ